MNEFLELNPWVMPMLAFIAIAVFVAGVLALLCVGLGAWLLRTAVRARKTLGMVATIAAVPGKSGKAKFAIGLMVANLFSGISGRFRKAVTVKK